MTVTRIAPLLSALTLLSTIGCQSASEGVSTVANLTPRDIPVAGPAIHLGRQIRDEAYEIPGRVVHSVLSPANPGVEPQTPEQREAARRLRRRSDLDLPPTAEDRIETRRAQQRLALDPNR